MKEVRDFFGDMADEYNAAIERCVPRYREMLDQLIAYAPAELQPRRICELGCGTGNLTQRLAARWPTAELHVVDISTEMLDICQRRLGASVAVRAHCQDFREFSFEDNAFDMVVSSISLHHLDHGEKQTLFHRVLGGLRAGGVLTFSDQMAGVTDALYQRHLAAWKAWSEEAGTSAEEWDAWMRHQDEHDHHESFAAHAQMLSEAGFVEIDCLWRNLLWTIVQARASSD